MASKSKRKRKIAFAEEVDICDKKNKQFEDSQEDLRGDNQRKSRFKEKHSLDSDEEDYTIEETETGLDDEDLAAQEDCTITQDGDIKVTPFNLKEEMEEGYFDSHGNYFQKDSRDQIKDSWMDDLDWAKIEEQREWNKTGGGEGSEEDDNPLDKITVYQQILDILKPGETLLKGIKRLGGDKSMSASERWKKNKSRTEDIAKDDQSHDKALLEKLTGLADQLLAIGEYSIYEDTYEKIKYKIQLEQRNKDPVDIFSDKPITSTSDGGSSSQQLLSADEVMWEYRWEDNEGAELHGPFSSTQMSEWKENGYFKDGVFVKKCNNQDAKFYSSKRMDFDLYT